MKTFFLFIAFFSINSIFSQHIVLDSLTKEPIPFPLVSTAKEHSSFYANVNGIFELQGNFNYEKVEISCLGYEPYIKKINILPDTIFLKPKIEHLKEIVIQNTSTKFKKIGFLKKSNLDWFINSKTQIGILIIPKKANIESKIEKINIPITKKIMKYHNRPFKSVFKINTYTNKNGFPNTSISEKPFIIKCNQDSEKIVTIDISNEQVYLPKEGLFLTIEMIGEIDEKGNILELKNPLPAFKFSSKSPSGFLYKQYYKTVSSNEWRVLDFKKLPFKKEFGLAINIIIQSH